MTKDELSDKFQIRKETYHRLGQNIVEALKTFLIDAEIQFLDTYYRVKSFKSFYEKIKRKNYADPFTQTEDLCGIRIICYYNSDLEKVKQIINSEFQVFEQEDKSRLLGLNEFAYRSDHYIVGINNDWLKAPNYRNLQGIKAEIQVRTILMHAWAEVEHKLNYKSDSQVPEIFQRKLFRLSAKFEEADEQFEELRDGIKKYREKLKESIKTTNTFNNDQESNRETIISFLNFHFPDMPSASGNHLDDFIEQVINKKLSFHYLEDIINRTKPHVKEISDDLLNGQYGNDLSKMPTELIGFGIQIIENEPIEGKMKVWQDAIIKFRKKINKADNKR